MPTRAVSDPGTSPGYRERHLVPVRGVLAVLLVALIAAAELHGGAGGWRTVVPYAGLLPTAVVVLVLLSRGEVRVDDGVLHVPGARAPLTAFGAPEVLDGPALRRALGPEADALAWVAVRPWHRRAVKLPVVDPEDDTPYWVVGTRRPVALLDALS
ncbi:MAG TPA: DUF3093 domain-containing protein [Mycobacteriales bacterium]|nr:DUF3093 domain-containing protein [Mycobacteriales bacterium]